jgi:hypothetical protein
MDELHPAPDIFQDIKRAQEAMLWRQLGSLRSWAFRLIRNYMTRSK